MQSLNEYPVRQPTTSEGSWLTLLESSSQFEAVTSTPALFTMISNQHYQTECCKWPPALSMRPGLLLQVCTHSLAASIASAPLKPPLYSTLMAVSGSERTSLKAPLHAVLS